MVVPSNYLLSFGLRTSHRSPTWNPSPLFIRPLNSWTKRHYKLRWPIVTGALVLFSKIFSRVQGSLCPQLFDDAKIHFNPISTLNISVTAVSGRGSSVGLRLVPVRESLMQLKLRWVLFTTPTKYPPNMDVFQIRFIGDNDPSYGDNNNRAGMIRQGKVAFRTCFHLALIPASYVIQLANQAYSTTESNPSAFVMLSTTGCSVKPWTP